MLCTSASVRNANVVGGSFHLIPSSEPPLERPAVRIKVAEHEGPPHHEDDEEGEEHQTRDELSLSSAFRLSSAGVGARPAEALGAALRRADAPRVRMRRTQQLSVLAGVQVRGPDLHQVGVVQR